MADALDIGITKNGTEYSLRNGLIFKNGAWVPVDTGSGIRKDADWYTLQAINVSWTLQAYYRITANLNMFMANGKLSVYVALYSSQLDEYHDIVNRSYTCDIAGRLNITSSYTAALNRLYDKLYISIAPKAGYPSSIGVQCSVKSQNDAIDVTQSHLITPGNLGAELIELTPSAGPAISSSLLDITLSLGEAD